MKKILLFCDTIIVDIILETTINLVKNNYIVFLQCEKIQTKDYIINFLKKKKLEKKIKVFCLHDYLLKNHSRKFDVRDFVNYEKKYNSILAEANISVSEFNIYHNYFKYYEDKLDINYHLNARILLIEKFYQDCLKDIQIDLAIVECRNHFNTISGILYFKKNNIPCYVPTSSIFKDFFSVNNVESICNPFLERFYFSKDIKIDSDKLSEDLKKISEKKSSNDREKNYLQNRLETLKQNSFIIILNYIKYIFEYKKYSLVDNFYLGKIHPIDLLKSRLKKRINYYLYKKKIINKNFSQFNFKKKCVFFLGLSPEASTYSQCNIFYDQRNVSRFIALNLPSNFELIIKEHPSQYVSSDGRDHNYYDEILSHSNVRLANPAEKAIDLIKDSEFVITSTGSVGIETILLNKPLIMIGNNHYQIYEKIYKVKDFKSLKDIIYKLTNDEVINVKFQNNQEKILKFLDSYQRSYFPGNIEIFYKKKFLSKNEYFSELEKISNSFLKIISKLTSNN